MEYSFLLRACLLLLLVAAEGCSNVPTISVVDSTALKNSVVAAHLEQPMLAGKNVVYCASFQLAWNELREKIVGEPVRLKNESKLVNFLNNSTVNKDSVGNDTGLMSMAGFGRDGIVERINQMLNEKYAGTGAPVSAISPDSILAYSHFEKELAFQEPFEEIKKNSLYFENSTRVKAFGIDEYSVASKHHDRIMTQVVRLYLRPDGKKEGPVDFALSIGTTSPTDELILAMVTPRDTLLATIESVEHRREPRDVPVSLNADQSLAIPDIAFHIEHAFTELDGAVLENVAAAGSRLQECRQDIFFTLNRKGVILKSKARLVAVASMPPVSSYRFDKPFLLYLKKKTASLPYFALWVDNPELLIKESK